MDKAVIFGAFEFVGFHLCKKLLEIGFEVSGIQFNQQIKNRNLDEKRLEIGRNSNFIEKTMEEWNQQMEEEENCNALNVFSFYDLFMGDREEKDIEKLLNTLSQRKKRAKNVFLLPIQLLTSECQSDNFKDLRNFLNNADEFKKDSQFFFLPTIYGPWQPETFLFQKAMLKILKEQEVTREWIGDAIFIDDAIELMIDQINTKKTGQFLLESGRQNGWNECAEFLMIDSKYFRNRSIDKDLRVDEYVIKLPVKKLTPIPYSLTVQKEHLHFFSNY